MFIEMFQLLLTVMPVEASLILTRVREYSDKVVVKLLDTLKQGLGSLVAKTVVATMLVLFGSVRFRSTHVASSTDQGMFANRLPEAFLMGNNNSIAFSFIHHFCVCIFLIYFFFLIFYICEKWTLLFLVLASGECTTTQESFNRKKETWRLQ
ncbi:hypothetical protein DY000_02042249 [Brassica cretica]|uniref:Endoplasmic reticulum transmembrane protein n=1 Tax=Brassica cretica TaxID=69181 RepID=A0ABQ7B6F1_BRACR|nr:hypothetical protein DY000_02042249 [Brassica cretica]